MRIFSDADEFDKSVNDATAAAFGKFDGLHKGHFKLLENVLKQKKSGLSSLVLTFDGSFADYFSGEKSGVLSTNTEKEDLLRDMGVDHEFVMPINEETVAMEPEDFVELLVKKLHVRYIAAGPDVSFGAKGRGDINLLKKLAEEYSVEVEIIEKVKLGDDVISSSLIKNLIAGGKMELAQAVLGRPYSLEGMVTRGRMLGRKLEMPTVNLSVEPEKMLPPYGVYFSHIFLGTGVFLGITNVGVRPTVSEEKKVSVETYIYDFDDDVYGETLRVELLHFLRGEKKFENIEELKSQMRTDMLRGRIYFS
ncbi:MAG: bifunctional riboflavin kinase/FAD synthetase [Lachnospiraceae bacterium]|nr:bifunctional riboflavin kinase/FAD synthetase [Lachnospiraceae bacterium]